jgi:hypothetical protein
MKNKLPLFALALLTLGSFTACKKKVQTCKISRVFTSDGTTTPAPAVFSYNSNGSLNTIVYPNQSKDSLSYDANTTRLSTYDNAGHLISEMPGIVNGSGYFTSAGKVTYDLLGNGTSQLLVFYYNGEGNLTSRNIGSDRLTYQMLNGNAVSASYEHNNVVTKRYEFFRNAVANKTGIDDLNGVYQPYFGKPSANLLDSLYIIDLNANDTTRIQYVHTLNADDYVNTTKVQTYHGNSVSTAYITYQYRDCK